MSDTSAELNITKHVAGEMEDKQKTYSSDITNVLGYIYMLQ